MRYDDRYTIDDRLRENWDAQERCELPEREQEEHDE